MSVIQITPKASDKENPARMSINVKKIKQEDEGTTKKIILS